jgi:hypothetical protein
MNNSYYWGTSDTTISFCEKKYDQVYWIAEYNNTFSATAYIIFGLFFLLTKIKHVGVSMITLGFSTMVLHGTLRFYGQWLDECSMLIITYSAIKLINNSSNYGYLVLIVYYLIIKDYFILFFLMFFGMQLYIVYLTYLKNISKHQNIFIKLYIVCFLLGTICWLVDQFLCKQINDIPFHAAWHILSALGMFYGFLSFLL